MEPDAEPTSNFDPDRTAVEQWRALVGFASAVTGDGQLGQDLAQIAYTELITTTTEVHDEQAWLRTVVTRRAKNHWRSMARERAALRRMAADVGNDRSSTSGREPDRAIEVEPDTTQCLIEAIEELPHRQRAAVLLVYGEDRSTEEAARIIGCAQATLRVHLHRARKHLRRTLGEPQEATDHG